MKKSIFFDSWGWIAVVDRKDPYHETAKPFYQEYVNGGGIPITTDYILDEVLTALRKRLTHEVVVKLIHRLRRLHGLGKDEGRERRLGNYLRNTKTNLISPLQTLPLLW